IYSRNNDIHLRVWDLITKQAVVRLLGGVHHYAMDFTPDGKQIAVGQKDGAIVFYDLPTGIEARRWNAVAMPHSLAFHPSGKKLAISSLEGKAVEVRDVATGDLVGHPIHQPAGIRGLAWRPDGNLLAMACAN